MIIVYLFIVSRYFVFFRLTFNIIRVMFLINNGTKIIGLNLILVIKVTSAI